MWYGRWCGEGGILSRFFSGVVFFILCEGFWVGVVVAGDGIALNEYILLTAFSHNLLRFQFKLLLLLFTLLVLLLRRL